jgi:hypothetical protein
MAGGRSGGLHPVGRPVLILRVGLFETTLIETVSNVAGKDSETPKLALTVKKSTGIRE